MSYINICAVDPEVIPYGSIVFVVFELGNEKIYIAGDCGALVIGDHIDLMVPTKEEALEFGTRHLPVKVIKAGDFSDGF
jgi:3D (Asp-Asp-Asp) domain-containing protein